MTTSATPTAMSMVGSRPESIGGSGSGSSPGGGCISGGSSIGCGIDGNGGGSIIGISGTNYLDYIHYERMPLPIPIPIVPPPPPLHLNSEEEIEPAYATGILYIYMLCIYI